MFLSTTLTHSSREILGRIVGHTLIDVVGPEHRHERDEISGRVRATAFGVIVEGVSALFIDLRDIVIQKQIEAIVLNVNEVYTIRSYPGGPAIGWESLGDIALSTAGRKIEKVGILASTIDGENSSLDEGYEIEDGLVLHLSGGRKLVIEASDLPMWLELWCEPTPISVVIPARKERALI